jgi:amidophosphoribosyltransferase
VVVIDDSIIRGTSSASIVQTLKKAGARRIYMIITYPPVKFPCYAGIDFPSREELLANKESLNIRKKRRRNFNDRIAKLIDADKVYYNDTSNLAKAIGILEKELCFTCSTGDYSPLGIIPKFRTREEVKGESV